MKYEKNWKRGEKNVASVVFTEPAEYDLLDIEYYILLTFAILKQLKEYLMAY